MSVRLPNPGPSVQVVPEADRQRWVRQLATRGTMTSCASLSKPRVVQVARRGRSVRQAQLQARLLLVPKVSPARRFKQPRRLQREVDTAGVPVGLLAYVNDQPAGWTRVVPRHTLAGVRGNRAVQRILGDDGAAWWVTCFAIRREYRGRGVGAALLNASVRSCPPEQRLGAGRASGRPEGLKGSPSALFTGTLSMFQAAGFREIDRTYPSRPVMRKDLSRAGP
jgi:GNAT superfamily N-acetyltransferase